MLPGNELAAETDVREGRPSEVILQCASELRSDLIVIGAKGLMRWPNSAWDPLPTRWRITPLVRYWWPGHQNVSGL